MLGEWWEANVQRFLGEIFQRHHKGIEKKQVFKLTEFVHLLSLWMRIWSPHPGAVPSDRKDNLILWYADWPYLREHRQHVLPIHADPRWFLDNGQLHWLEHSFLRYHAPPPVFQSMREKLSACFVTSKNGVFCYNIAKELRNFFRGIILSRICQRFIERGLSANWLLFGRRAVYGIFRFQFSHHHYS